MSEKQPIIVEFDDNRTGTTYTCNAGFIEPYPSFMHDGYLSIQMSDVMAFGNGDGEPVNGVTISLDPVMRETWLKAIAGDKYRVVDREALTEVIDGMRAMLGNPYLIDAETLLYVQGRALQRWIAALTGEEVPPPAPSFGGWSASLTGATADGEGGE